MLSVVKTDNPPSAAIFGLSGTALSGDERAFFKETNPLGFILFTRNCESPEQIRALIADLNDCLGRVPPVLIDQEGGRVQRLKPPHWSKYLPAARYGTMFLDDFESGLTAIKKDSHALAAELAALGIRVNCAPVLDIRTSDTHEDIGDRAYASDPSVVAALGGAVCRSFLDEGVIPVVKHMPGLGRASVNSHEELPRVSVSVDELLKTDLLPYAEILDKPCSQAVWGMMTHATYPKIDPRLPASCSRRIIFDLIRETLGFDGMLLSDDISMGALDICGDVEARAEMVLRGGCDIVLHCNGDMNEMENVAKSTEKMTSKAVMRYNRSVEWMTGQYEHAKQHAV